MLREFSNLTLVYKNGTLPRVPFLLIKEKILGKNYNLSVVFVSDKESCKINKKWRGKNYPANILSFPLEKKSGEIYISINTAKKEAPKFGLSLTKFLNLLFIHGCLHLKGHLHGSRMELLEDKLLKTFTSGKTKRTNSDRSRHR